MGDMGTPYRRAHRGLSSAVSFVPIRPTLVEIFVNVDKAGGILGLYIAVVNRVVAWDGTYGYIVL